jgi:hypothetical protein
MFMILHQISHCSQAAQEITASVRASMNACLIKYGQEIEIEVGSQACKDVDLDSFKERLAHMLG